MKENSDRSRKLAAEIDKTRAEIDQVTQPHQDEIDSVEILKALEERLNHFRDLLLDNKPGAPQVLSELLKGPLMFEANEDGSFSVTGETAIGPLLPPSAVSAILASPGWFEPPLPP